MGYFLLFAQLGLFFLLFFLSNLFAVFSTPLLLILFLLGSAVGGLGLLGIGRRSYSPLPQPKEENRLSQRGIYRIIRHPMYSGLMLAGLSFLLSRLALLTGLVFSVFVLVNILKANLEERLLSQRHPEYERYKRQVRKFFPGVW